MKGVCVSDDVTSCGLQVVEVLFDPENIHKTGCKHRDEYASVCTSKFCCTQSDVHTVKEVGYHL